ncbi:MAG: hypothetical protein J5496_00980 [Lachnospiraceae bacterium]|nr:hypothetical protein [Lachnospiraceae bacterium]
MRYYHHDHHGEGGCGHEHGCHRQEHGDALPSPGNAGEGCPKDREGAASQPTLSDLDKARMLLDHMLDHNRHHEEEMAALAERFAAAGEEKAAKKIRTARARMVEANLALMEAVNLIRHGCAVPPSPEGKAEAEED